jgi:hypothetical protein
MGISWLVMDRVVFWLRLSALSSENLFTTLSGLLLGAGTEAHGV